MDGTVTIISLDIFPAICYNIPERSGLQRRCRPAEQAELSLPEQIIFHCGRRQWKISRFCATIKGLQKDKEGL